jgi:c-di-GMP-binding flagellar brake protein YcgR
MRLHELNLPIGKMLSINIVGQDYKKHQFDAQLMGYQKNQSVALTLLSKPGQVLLHTGQKLTVSAALPDGTVEFESEIERVVESPFLYLLVEYPGSVNFRHLRQHIRVRQDTPVEVNAHTGLGMTTSVICGHMLDISYGGARLVLEKELTTLVTKITIGVMLESEGLEKNISLKAEIRNKSALSEYHPDCTFAYGVEFVGVDPVDDLFLRAFCLQEVNRGKALLC